MRRVIGLGLATALLAVTPAIGATAHGPSAYRKVIAGYGQPGGTTLGTPDSTKTHSSPTITDTARDAEDSVAITARDKSGSPIALAVLITPYRSTVSTLRLVCTSTTVRVSKGTRIAVTPLAGLCTDKRTSVPQGGSIDLNWHRYLPAPKAQVKAPTAPTAPTAPASLRWALLVGIRDYAGNTASTVGGTGDVNAIKQALLNSGWSASHIMVITDRNATATGIRNGFAWLAARSSARSFSLMHFSGHMCIASRGPCPAGHTYLWSHDNKFIPETEVVSRMKAVKGYQWMDMAGCQSGGMNAGYHSATRMFTSSSRSYETSYEQPSWGMSVWTGLAWARGYNQGLADSSGRRYRATIGQLATYGARETAGYTATQKAGVQHPVYVGGSGSWSLSAPPGG